MFFSAPRFFLGNYHGISTLGLPERHRHGSHWLIITQALDFIFMIPMVIPKQMMDKSGGIPMGNQRYKSPWKSTISSFSYGEIHHFPFLLVYPLVMSTVCELEN